MGKWKTRGDPKKVMSVYLDRKKFRTRDGVIECPDMFDEQVDGMMLFDKVEEGFDTNKITETDKNGN